jgi:hypothetical protein
MEKAMSTTKHAAHPLPFGLFETNSDGPIIQFSPAKKDGPSLNRQDVVGRNLLRDVSPLFSSAEFQEQFLQFMSNWAPADSFLIDTGSDGPSGKVRVLLGKLFDKEQIGRIEKIFVKVSEVASLT